MTAKNWKPQLLVAELNKGSTQLQVAFHDVGADDEDDADADDADADADDEGHEHFLLALSPSGSA